MPWRTVSPGSIAGPMTIWSSPSSKRSCSRASRAILRRGDRPMLGVVEAGALRVDLAARVVTYDAKPVSLGTTEFRLLEFLARNAGIALSRAQIVERIWDYDFDGSSNIVDVYVSQLRRKLKSLGAASIIETVWGIGYRLRNR